MKKCSVENCSAFIFSKRLCKYHWYKEYGKPLKKLSKKGVIKKQEKKKMLCEDFNFYLKLWEILPHKCGNCNTNLGNEPRLYYFDHILTKQAFPQYRHDTKNIWLLCLDCHSLKTNGILSENMKNKIEETKNLLNET